MFILPTINSALKQRLKDEIKRLRKEIPVTGPEEKLKIAEQAISTLDEADNLNERKQFDSGWNLLHISEQLLVKAMSEAEVIIKSDKLRIEALDKIKGFRRDQIRFFLGDKPSTSNIDYSQQKLLEAMKIYADYYDTRNHRLALHKASVFLITVISTLVLLGIIGLSYWQGLEIKNISYGLVMVGLFGFLGACFSIVRSFLSFKLDSKIPEQIVNTTITGIRLLVGAISAIVIYLMMRSGVFNNIFSAEIVNSKLAYITYSFIAGYSERWTTKILNLISQDNVNTEKENKKPDGMGGENPGKPG